MKIYIGADHRGFDLKEKIRKWLLEEGFDVRDCGNTVYDRKDDYTDFAFAVADEVAKSPDYRGIVICGSGVGVNIAANKIAGIRCSTVERTEEAHHGREHDNLNVLALSANYTSEDRAKELVRVFLVTAYGREERFIRRLKKIEEREKC